MAKGKKKTTLWVVLAAVILAIFALGKLGGSEPGTTARQTTAAVTETTVQITAGTTAKQTAGTAKAKTAAKKKQTAAKVPAFSGKPYVALDDNQPHFSAKDKKRRSAYESYAPLDSLGRCGVAFACLCKETMPTEKRGEIGQVRPSGWHTVKYDTVDGKYLYNRCHLIGYQLTAENANVKNLITGTRYLNVQGMLPFENLTADYVKETGNHVMYRVTPVFEGNNLVASGVLMEAESVEDQGEGVLFCVYVYNVQPGIAIDYATGESWADGSGSAGSTAGQGTAGNGSSQNQSAGSGAAGSSGGGAGSSGSSATVQTYILNTNSKKFHLPSCTSVTQMKAANRQEFTGTRDEVIADGYEPCKNCNP